MPSSIKSEAIENAAPALPLRTLILLQLAVAAGALLAVWALPRLLPGLSASLLGSAPKVYWYLSRASALVAFVLLWFAMAIGLLITNKLARAWPGGPTAFELHQFASLLGLDLALFHGLILLGDHYMRFSLAQVMVPFATPSYRPVWTGLGQIGFYLFAIVSLSFYGRRFMGPKTWRAIYLASGASLLFLTVYRVLISVAKPNLSRVR